MSFTMAPDIPAMPRLYEDCSPEAFYKHQSEQAEWRTVRR